MEFSIGSNTIRNTNGVIKVEGKDQIFIEVGADLQPLLTMDVYDARGTHIAKIIRNNFIFDSKTRYKIKTGAGSVSLLDRELGNVIVEAIAPDRDKIHLPQGSFYSPKAHLVEINSKYWRVLGNTVSNSILDSHGGAVQIGN